MAGKIVDPNRFYVYVHKRATDGVVFYVGKGSGVRAYRTADRNQEWAAVVAEYGRKVLFLEKSMSEAAALQLEQLTIAEYRARGLVLTNRTDGGDGGGANPCDETRRLMREAKLGKKRGPHTEEHRRNIALSQLGKVVSEETRKRISAATSAAMKSPAAVEKMRAAKLGKQRGPMSEETKAKISAAHKGMLKPWLSKPRKRQEAATP